MVVQLATQSHSQTQIQQQQQDNVRVPSSILPPVVVANAPPVPGNFDAYNEDSWFYGSMTRAEATNVLMEESEIGVFLVRSSTTVHGDFVLSVKESSDKVSHYIINKILINKPGASVVFKIGEQPFPDMPSLLEFYKHQYLDMTNLTRPITRPQDHRLSRLPSTSSSNTLRRACDTNSLHSISSTSSSSSSSSSSPDEFGGQQHLTLKLSRFTSNSAPRTSPLSSPHSTGQHIQINAPSNGSINSSLSPKNNLVHSHTLSNNNSSAFNGIQSANNQLTANVAAFKSNGFSMVDHSNSISTATFNSTTINSNTTTIQRKLPSLARVIQARVPNAYDKTALTLKIGDIINVTDTHMSGQWEGELNGRKGHFPFTHVEFIDSHDHTHPSLISHYDN